MNSLSLVLMALVLIASVGGKSISRSLFSGFLGILFAMPGIVAATGEVRMTFGLTELNGGFKLLPMLIGLFAISQIITDVIEKDKKVSRIEMSMKGMFMSGKEWLSQTVNLIRSRCNWNLDRCFTWNWCQYRLSSSLFYSQEFF